MTAIEKFNACKGLTAEIDRMETFLGNLDSGQAKFIYYYGGNYGNTAPPNEVAKIVDRCKVYFKTQLCAAIDELKQTVNDILK